MIQQLETARHAFEQARQTWIEHGAEIDGRLSERISYQARQIDQLEQHQQERRNFLEQHPELVDDIGRPRGSIIRSPG